MSKFPSVKSKGHPALIQNKKEEYIKYLNHIIMKFFQLKISNKTKLECANICLKCSKSLNIYIVRQ